ncbi:hypothetical protein D187_007387 [Cystobacter fuscus DSM 2262]|uniref:Uncharacterized protein n=1 Tax=Cystobacter fuscus (strain ATCC 25194 / DSM 2262 / NBRC 100088 / M29) TaxID=1242864 RepID=S9NV57_CYSF2|nr:hypothetical protein [Cystobacter fuscus]EPX56045.1 hypothetical protein D187_007387 [Cystobacter fuscus DSM 2262]
MDTVTTSISSASVLSSSFPLPAGTREALDAFFRSFGFSQESDLSRLAVWALGARRVDSREAALALARERMEHWLAEALGQAHVAHGALLARGRAAFVLCEGARWGAAVLLSAPGALPVEFTRALRASVPVPAPRPLPTTMPEQTLTTWSLGELLRRWWRVGEPDVSVSR